MPELTREQEQAVEKLAEQFDSVLVARGVPAGVHRVVATCLDNPQPCTKHADDGVVMTCPLCSYELRGQYIIESDGSTRGQ